MELFTILGYLWDCSLSWDINGNVKHLKILKGPYNIRILEEPSHCLLQDYYS